MNVPSKKRIKMLTILMITLGAISCSKDTDLLADYVISGSNNASFRNFVVDDVFSITQETSITLNVLANDNFVNTENVEITETSTPKNGTVVINDNKTITYTLGNGGNTDSSVDNTTVTTVDNTVEPSTSQSTLSQESGTAVDTFTYTTETVDAAGSVVTEQGTVTIVNLDMGNLRAFPGAEGFGKFATGGRGGSVIEVTNLNDSGSGSLRAAIETSGARTVIFKVAGYITLQNTLSIRNSAITIAGQTAPGDGITIRRSSNMTEPALSIDTGNVIIRGIRIRSGRGQDMEYSGDNAGVTLGSDIIFDHCSFSWSTDENVAPSGATRITFQNCIIAEGLMFSSLEYSTDPNNASYPNSHSMGMLVSSGSDEISIYNSIFAHNNDRNPYIAQGSSNGGFELVNNVYYNWGIYGTTFEWDAHLDVNIINNLYIPGPNTKMNRHPILLNDQTTAYARGNITHFRTSSSEPEWNAIGDFNVSQNIKSTNNQSSSPFDYPLKDTPTISQDNLLSQVTSIAGAFVRDDVDARIIQDIYRGTGQLIDDPSEVGGYPSLASGTPYQDSDKDGISDDWELQQGLNPNDYEDGRQDRDGDGYTNLEEFLHYLAGTF